MKKYLIPVTILLIIGLIIIVLSMSTNVLGDKDYNYYENNNNWGDTTQSDEYPDKLQKRGF